MITKDKYSNTPVKIEHRIYAFLIDFLVLGLITLVTMQSESKLVSFLTPFFYYLIMESVFDKTIGKLILGYIVIDSGRKYYEEKRMYKQIFIRTLCRYIPFDYISFAFTDNHQLWHDNLSNTKVIYKSTISENYFEGEPTQKLVE